MSKKPKSGPITIDQPKETDAPTFLGRKPETPEERAEYEKGIRDLEAEELALKTHAEATQRVVEAPQASQTNVPATIERPITSADEGGASNPEQETAAKRIFWISWYEAADDDPGEDAKTPDSMHWWCTGIRCEDNAQTICARIEATDVVEAKAIAAAVYGRSVDEIEWRFEREKEAGWWPSPDRFRPVSLDDLEASAEPAVEEIEVVETSELGASRDGYGEGFRDGLKHAVAAISKRRRMESARGVHSILDDLVKKLERAATAA